MMPIFYQFISEEISFLSTIKESSKIIFIKELVDTSGSTEKLMMELGRQVKWMAMGNSFGIMEATIMKDNTKMI